MKFKANRLVKTSVATFEIIEYMSTKELTPLTTLAEELDMSKGIVHNHLSTLRELGYVRKSGDKYQLTPKFFHLGLEITRHSRIYTASNPLLEDFQNEFNKPTLLCEEAGTDGIITASFGTDGTTNIDIGTRVPMRESLLGLVIYAMKNTKQDDDFSSEEYKLESLVPAVSNNGYATGPISNGRPPYCLAVPLLNDDSECHSCIGVLISESETEQQTERLIEATLELKKRIQDRANSDWEATRSFATEKHSWIS